MADAFSLHNFLRALPVKLTMHAVGAVDSAAMPVFLAGEERFCCADSTFLFHDLINNFSAPISFTRTQFTEFVEFGDVFTTRAQNLLKTRASFKDEDFKTLQLFQKGKIYDATFAKQMGIVQEIKEASITAGFTVANIDY